MVQSYIEGWGLSKRRFTVSLDEEDYQRLRSLAYDHRPQLSMPYVVRYAIRELLKETEDPQLALQLRDPTDEEGNRGR